MLRSISAPLFLIGSAVMAQLPVEDFETAGFFDVGNVQTYCAIGALQGSTDTHAGTSAWSLEFPYTFQGTCPYLTPGIFVPLNGVGPGDQFTVEHWQKLQSTGTAVLTQLVYVHPSTGMLPPDPNDLQNAAGGIYWGTAPGSWTSVTDNFNLPSGMPWPSDVYLWIHVPTDSLFMTSTLVDDVTLTPAIGTDIMSSGPTSTELRIAPQPAADRITVFGSGGGPVEIHDSAGARVTGLATPLGNGVWEVHQLPPGIYLLRQGGRSARFLKG